MEEQDIMYNKRVWLNNENSGSTGSAVAFCGRYLYEDDEEELVTSLTIGDCKGVAKLHRAYAETNEDFIEKMKNLRTTVDDFISFLTINKEKLE